LGILLCFIQNLFVVLGAIATIIALIKAMLNLSFNIPPCGDSGNLTIDEACCSSEVCPSFIKNHVSILSTTGSFKYSYKVQTPGLPIPSGFPLSQAQIDSLSPTLQNEAWTLYDQHSGYDTAFNNIVTAYDVPPEYSSNIFFPNVAFDDKSDPKKVPYKADIKFLYTPTASYWNSYADTTKNRASDPLGTRKIIIKDCIVERTPTVDVTTHGNLSLVGGKAYEEDGTTPFKLNGVQANIRTFFSTDTILSSTLPINNGILIENVEYTFYINHESLAGYSLITIGCFPDVAADKDTVNSVFAGPITGNAADLLGVIGDPNSFPDMAALSECVMASINKFRTNVSTAGAAIFQSEIVSCLEDTLAICKNGFGQLVKIGFDPYKSKFELDPTLQFTTKPIKVKVDLNDVNGLPLCQGIETDIAEGIAADIIADITFGTMSKFTYDGVQSFTGDLTSTTAGKGKMKIEYAGKIIGTATVPTDLTQPIVIKETEIDFEFIYANLPTTGEDAKPRRDESDTAGDVNA